MVNWNTFGPKEYLDEYYLDLDKENKSLLEFYSRTYTDQIKGATFLEFGSGPTIYSLISAANFAKEIHVCDILKRNLTQIQKWIDNPKETVWKNYFKYSLRIEGNSYSANDIEIREQTLRKKIKIIGKCNALSKHPLEATGIYYDVVATNFCPESITDKRHEWESALENIFSLLKKGGLGVITALKEADYYDLNGKRFPTVNIKKNDLVEELIKIGFKKGSIVIKSIKTHPSRGYRGIIMISGVKIK